MEAVDQSPSTHLPPTNQMQNTAAPLFVITLQRGTHCRSESSRCGSAHQATRVDPSPTLVHPVCSHPIMPSGPMHCTNPEQR